MISRKPVAILAAITLLLCLFLIAREVVSASDAEKLEQERKQAIYEINEGFDAPFHLLEPFAAVQASPDYALFDEGGGFGCMPFFSDDIDYVASGYPDTLDEFHITEFIIKTEKYAVMGISFGQSVADAGESMIQRGFLPVENSSYNSYSSRRYTKNGVSVCFDAFGGKITRISVSVETTNIRGIIY